MNISSTISVKVDGKDREIFMSYGLITTLTKIVKSPEEVAQIFVTEEVRLSVLLELLATRKVSGKITHPVKDIDDVDISIDDVMLILGWAGDHLMSFFVKSLRATISVTENHTPDLVALNSSLTGLQN